MSEMGGPELADRMAAAYPEMKVLFMSGYADSTIRRRGGLKSRMALLSKPFSPEALVREVLDVPLRP
jgi:CheY-like chemotaxis protein